MHATASFVEIARTDGMSLPFNCFYEMAAVLLLAIPYQTVLARTGYMS
jgi:hypothetical protein